MQENNENSEKEGIGRKASGNSRKKGEKREKREVSLEYLRWKVIEARQKIDGRNDGVFETKYSDCHKMI